MRIGVAFPQLEIGTDPGAIVEFVQAAEGLGYRHLLIYDHVLGADRAQYPDLGSPRYATRFDKSRPYDYTDLFHEPFVLCGFLAGRVQRIEFATGVLVLPQRQTALVAKQAAEVDVLTGGRLRLGVGVGWNFVEYEALGMDFHSRGQRLEEQIGVLRALWTQELVTFEGRWHRIMHAGINPLPVRRPIPIWLGGYTDPVERRVGRVADGWIPRFPPTPEVKASIHRVRRYAREAGRDPNLIGIEGRVVIAGKSEEGWVREAQEWKQLGASHLTMVTMEAGFASVVEHVRAMERFRDALGPLYSAS